MKRIISSLVILFVLFSGCSKQKPPFKEEEIKKAYLTLEKQQLLIGTGYWRHVSSISIQIEKEIPKLVFYMNNSYWNIKDTTARNANYYAYRKMQRAFERQVHLKREIRIDTK